MPRTLPLNLLPNPQTHKRGLSLTPSAQIFLPSQSSGPPSAALLSYQSPDNSESGVRPGNPIGELAHHLLI